MATRVSSVLFRILCHSAGGRVCGLASSSFLNYRHSPTSPLNLSRHGNAFSSTEMKLSASLTCRPKSVVVVYKVHACVVHLL